MPHKMNLIFTNKMGSIPQAHRVAAPQAHRVAPAAPQAQRAAASMTMIVNRQKTTIQSIINSPIVSCGCGH